MEVNQNTAEPSGTVASEVRLSRYVFVIFEKSSLVPICIHVHITYSKL